MSVIAMIQARMTSSRLPGKVLEPVLGEPMLWRMVERVHHARQIDRVVVIISREPSDDPLWRFCHNRSIDCFRGPLNDVLGRFWLAAQRYRPDHIVRLTADCPLIDPEVIDAVVAQHLADNNDYTSNCLEYSLPDGLDVEVVSYTALERLAHSANRLSEREHVTLGIRHRGEGFQTGSWVARTKLSGMRWTVDYPQDLEFVRQVFNGLYPNNPDFGLSDVLALLAERPELHRINPDIPSNEGMTRSLQTDYEVTINEYGQVPELD